MNLRINICFTLSLALLLMLSSCASDPMVSNSDSLLAEGHIEEGLAELEKAANESPRNHEIRNHYYRQRELQINSLLNQAETARKQGQLEEAEAGFNRVLGIDRANDRAKGGLESVQIERGHQERIHDAEGLFKKGNLIAADAIAQKVLIENPKNKDAVALRRRIAEKNNVGYNTSPTLKGLISKPIALEFRDASLKSVFELLSRNAGINFVFDKDLRPDIKITLFIKNSTVEDVIRVILVTNQLEQKVLNENTILIYPNTQAKQKDYQELVTKSFYIANGDVKTIANTIKTLVKTKDMVVDENLNYLALRDTPEAVRLAEKLIANQDIPNPEVIMELEVLEVSTNRLKELGIRYPDQLSLSLVGKDNTPGTIQLNEAKNFDSGLVRLTVTNPALIFNLRATDTDTNLLGNPRIRVKNHDKAKVHVGERVPVITTTSTANVGVSESVSYLDVGLKLEVEPSISLEDEVSMKVGLEVSNILETITRASGLQTYRLGTRNTATTLMLKDGETQVLAGLIQDDERKTADKVPGLANLPIIGRLFSSRNQTNTKTEIVLLITPHIVRNITRPEAQDTEFLSGTDTDIGAAPVRLRSVESTTDSKTIVSPLSTTPAVRPTAPLASALDKPAEDTPLKETSAATQPVDAPQQKPTLPLPSAFSAPPATQRK